MKKMLFVKPGENPEVVEIDGSLESLQEAVGGYIEVAYPWPGRAMGIICNEEAKVVGMPLNRGLVDSSGRLYDIIAGPFLVCGLGEDDFAGLEDEQLQWAAARFQSQEIFVRGPGGKIVALPIPV